MTILTLTLAARLLAAMLSWTHVPADCSDALRCEKWERIYMEPVDSARARYAEIADQVALEAEARGGPDKIAFDLIAIAFEETQFHRLVDDGTCNSSGLGSGVQKRVEAIGGCDGGTSYSVWQLHMKAADERANVSSFAGRRIEGGDLLGDRALAIHVAWGLRLSRPSAWAVWPRAARRSALWLMQHPTISGQAVAD